MNLEELITALEATDPNRLVARGFSNPHSYRGDYMDLAFEPATDIRVGEMLDAARSALGATFQGWKGGEFTMSEHTWCWLSQEGDASGETISALLVELLLDRPAVSVVPPATNQTALRERIAEALVSWTYRGKEPDPETGMLETVRANAYSRADAVLAVLPAPVDRAAVLTEAAARYEEILANADTGQDPRYWTAVRDITLGLRAMADEEQAQAHLDQLAEELAAAIASCPGYEMNPNPCRCPCEGCKHHCGAHDPQPAVAEPEPGCAHCGGPHAWDDCEAYTALVAAEAPHAETPDDAAALLALVRDFLDPDPCSFDHHGYCQAHAAGFGGEPLSCPHGRARKLLEAVDEPAVVAQPGKEV